jgi:hypothetical protein
MIALPQSPRRWLALCGGNGLPMIAARPSSACTNRDAFWVAAVTAIGQPAHHIFKRVSSIRHGCAVKLHLRLRLDPHQDDERDADRTNLLITLGGSAGDGQVGLR